MTAALDSHDRRMLAVELDRTLEWLCVLRAKGEAVAGPRGFSKKARKLERKLYSTLASGWAEAADEAVVQAAELVLGGAGEITDDELRAVLDGVTQRMGAGFASEVMPGVRELLTDTYRLGRAFSTPAAGGDPKNVSFNVVDRRAVTWLERDAHFWIGSAYDRQLGEEIASGAAALMLEGGLGRKDAGKELKRTLSGQLLDDSVVGKDGYWEGLAAAAATRARSFGMVEGLVEGGIDRFEYVAVMDERTSDVCRELNGRIFEVATAVAARDAMLDSDDPQAVKTLLPWKRAADIKGKSSEALAAEGVMMPPAHFRCRSSVVAIEDGDVEPVERRVPSGASERTRNALGTLTPDEQTLKLQVVRANAQSAKWAAIQIERQADVHARSAFQFGRVLDRGEYEQLGRATLASAPEVYAIGAKDGGLVYHFVDSEARLVLTATDGGEILSLNGVASAPEATWRKFRANLRRRAVELRNVPAGRDAAQSERMTATHPEVTKQAQSEGDDDLVTVVVGGGT